MKNFTIQERRQSVQKQRKLYDMILQIQGPPLLMQPQQDKGILAAHFILKIIPLGLVVFDQLTALLFQQQYTGELIVLLVVVEFWATKNYIGKRMLGCKWYFNEDPWGEQRLMFQCRANGQLIDPTLPRLFWIIQFVYIVISGLLFAQALFIIPNAVRIQDRKLVLNFLIMLSGLINIFFFYVVTNCKFLMLFEACQQRQETLRRQIGIDNVKRMEYATIVGYYP